VSAAPIPDDEAGRLAAVRALDAFDTAPEPEFDALVEAAARVCEAPISLVTLIDGERQWFKANYGLHCASETPREVSFSAWAILADDVFEVADARLDARFANNRLVTDMPGIVFYAGVPLRLSDGSAAGTLCVIDRKPRRLNVQQCDILRCLGRVAARALQSRLAARGEQVALRALQESTDETRRLAEELAQQHELLRVTLQSIGDAVITTDALGNVVWLNPVAERMTGWHIAEAGGLPATSVFRVIDEEKREPAEHPVRACLAEGNVTASTGRIVLISRDGTEFGIEDSAAPIRDDRGALLGVVLVFHDVTEARRLSGEMRYRASHDALTGLINRSEFEIRMRRVLQRTHAEKTVHALLYLDLDQFKIVNDTCGHTVGDRLLHEVAKLLGDVVRQTDTIARLGGDEFAVILERCSLEQAQGLAQQICDRMHHFRYAHEDWRFRIGVSIGLVPIDDRWTTPAAILQAADTSCYAAKENGRNRVQIWNDSDLALRERHGELQWTARIENALDHDGFVLYAQRIEAMRRPTGGVRAEVLLRMAAGDGTLVPPGVFFPAAERFGLASRIDRWVLSKAIAWLGGPAASDRIEYLSVNLTAASIGDRDFHGWLLATLSAAGPAMCSKLCFDVTESAAVTSLADASLFIGQVRALQVRVALDDFGAGASAFGYLKMLPVDFLKIDGQFVSSVTDSALDEVTVRCFVDVAKALGVETVAEMVATPAVFERLRELGIDYVQGFLVHHPAPIDTLLRVKSLVAAD
jgi:diguanylate cyclase (GGDEF)-like protein/PAS domain S-box-containing protein